MNDEAQRDIEKANQQYGTGHGSRTLDPHSLPMWVIYDHPADYPDCYVARRWIIDASGPRPMETEGVDVLTSDTLDGLRDQIPAGMTCITRHANDDEVIVESWV